MIGGQNGFGIFKTPFDSRPGISTIWDSHPVVRISWLQLKFAARFSRLPCGVAPVSGRVRSLTIWCYEQEWHLKPTASRGACPRGFSIWVSFALDNEDQALLEVICLLVGSFRPRLVTQVDFFVAAFVLAQESLIRFGESAVRERSINVAKLQRAYGGCLGIRRR